MDREFHKIIRDRSEVSVRYDWQSEAIWLYSKPKARPCYSIELLTQYKEIQQEVIDYFECNDFQPKTPIKYFVSASQTPGIFNYGGDLDLFSELIETKDRKRFFEYAKLCIDVIYTNHVNLNLPLTTISLVEGDAFGGGFESAISSNVCIVEEQIRMGFPDMRFNLIPGVGAYSFLSRIVGTRVTEEIIKTGQIYEAGSLYEMGVISEMTPKGTGHEAVNNYIKNHAKVFNGMQALQAARKRYHSIDYSELIDIAEIWVDAAMNLTSKDLKMMHRIVNAQNKMEISEKSSLRTKQARRFDQEEITFPFKTADGRIITEDRRKMKDPRAKEG